MQQCLNCKCQVGSGISVCPYCGAGLPLETSWDRNATLIRPTASGSNGTFQMTYKMKTPFLNAAGVPASWELPGYYGTCAGYDTGVQEEQGNSTETLLLALLACTLVASLCEFAALLLLLL